MEKSSSDNLTGSGRALPRRSPRTGPSETLLNIKRSMKQKADQSESKTDFVKDDYEIAQSAKDMKHLETGVVYDDEMINHYCFWDQKYPENPERYTSVIKRCTELGLLSRCKRIASRHATREEILQLHDPELLDILEKSSTEDNYEILEEMSSKFDSIYLHKSTQGCATLAAGCAIALVDAICTNQIQNGMAIIRPPGHHAMRDEFCGYCFFNNAALAATHAIKNMGLNRILVLDWDVHHGQGTQRLFYDDPRVIYFSIHRYQNGTFWPELRESEFDYIGEKSGKGFNFNVPLNATGLTDADYMAIFHQILIPVAYQYEPELIIISAGYDAAVGCLEIQPELIIVSAGYDSALGDEKGEMELSPAVYAHFIAPLMGLAGGKVAVLLEGGYCIKSLSEGVALTLRTLLGDPVPHLHDFGIPSDSVVSSILNVISVQRPFWSCLKIQESFTDDGSPVVEVKGCKGNEKKNKIFPAERKFMPIVRFEGTMKEKPSVYETRDCYPTKLPAALASNHDRRLDDLKASTDLFVPPNRVAIAYSEAMTEHRSMMHRDHPEKPERIISIYKKMEEFKLLERCELVAPRLATKEELLLVHDENYVNDIEKTSELPEDELNQKSSAYDSVYLHPKTYECALLSAGSVLQVVDEVVLRRSRAGVAIVRPPGHHAESNAACGFCVFNNVSLAAKYAIERHGLKRILLVDWDVHHGNGTQRIFLSDNRVLYVSLHRHNNGKFFPCSSDANYDEVGVGKGRGCNVNIPWNVPGGGMTDGDYVASFFSIILPIAYQYDPELVLVSAGFDACVNDPLGSCKLTPEVFAHMTHWLMSLAGGRVVLCLEGGYNVVSISYAMTLCTKALLGDPLPPLTSTLFPSSTALETIRNVLLTQEKFWPCLRFNKILPEGGVFELKPLESKSVQLATEVVEVKPPETKMAPSEGEINQKKPSEVKLSPPSDAVGDQLVEKMKELEIDSRPSNCDSNYKPQDANENSRRNNANRPPARDADSENASGQADRPTLVEYLSENMQRLLNEEMYAVIPQPGCPHLVDVQAVPQAGINVETPCTDCQTTEENWICLICYSVHCGRYVNQHMVMHNEESGHPLTLSFTDLSVWCYVCEAYIDNMVLYAAKNAVHRSKFGSDLQWSYGVENQAPPEST